MAPIQKRSRLDRDDDNGADDDKGLESAKSRENVQRKKLKLSKANSTAKRRGNATRNGNEGSSVSGREDTPPPVNNEQSTQYEIERDAGFVHLENIEDDDIEAAIAIESRKKNTGENRPAESGIIESIDCINFMCHERLLVNFGPLINFVVGKNGSGKSALVAALQICLGVKAASTNRGVNLKGMVKTGRESSIVMVQIANRGPDAYLHDQYGDSIIVEKTFNILGKSTLKLKSKNGHTIAGKKRDLDDLIEHFQFQVDNPMNILTQDNAKQFITKSGPAEKYKFFIKGTQLEQLDTDYKVIHENAENVQQKVYQQEENVEILLKRSTSARQKAKRVQEHQATKDSFKKYRNLFFWAQVEAQERTLEFRAQQIEDSRKAIEAADADVALRDKEYEDADARLIRAVENVQKLLDDKAPLEDASKEAKEAWDSAKKEMAKAKIEQRNIHQEVHLQKEQVDSFKAQLKSEEDKLKAMSGGSHSRKLAAIDDANARVNEVERAQSQARVEIAQLEQQRIAAETALRQFDEPVRAKRAEVSKANERLQELNSDRANNTMAGYDPQTSRLMERIQNDRGFTSKPVGPIGIYCRLLKPVWSDVLESSLGNILNAFVVTNAEDQKRFQKLTKQFNARIPSFKVPPHLGNLNEPDDQFDTILRVLEIDNVLVKNALVLNARAEQILLIENEREAQRTLYNGAPPKYANQCFSIDHLKRGWGVKFTAGNNDTRGPIKRTNAPPRMKTDIAAQIQKQKDLLEDLRRELREIEGEQRKAQDKLKQCSQAVKRRQNESKSLDTDRQRAEDRVEQLLLDLESDQVEDGRLEFIKEQLDEAEEKLASQQRNLEDSQDRVNEQNNKCTSLMTAYGEAKELVTSYDSQIAKARVKEKRMGHNRQLSLQQKNDAYDNVISAKAEQQMAIGKHAEQADKVRDFVEQATEQCKRIPVPPNETLASIDAKLERFKSQLKEHQKRQGGTDEEIEAAALQTHKAWLSAAKNLKSIMKYCTLLKQSLTDRQMKWRSFQKLISAHSRLHFKYLLAQRRFRGGIAFDHKAKLLDVKVEPDATRTDDEGRQTKTLSGGEKSFSSICLLLSLWEAMGAPLRILDEYDVFMDEVNRDVSTRMIISAARNALGKQFILITPHRIAQEIEAANTNTGVVFHSMPDPRDRGQQTIEESMGV